MSKLQGPSGRMIGTTWTDPLAVLPWSSGWVHALSIFAALYTYSCQAPIAPFLRDIFATGFN
jgi:hypothetical protein